MHKWHDNLCNVRRAGNNGEDYEELCTVERVGGMKWTVCIEGDKIGTEQLPSWFPSTLALTHFRAIIVGSALVSLFLSFFYKIVSPLFGPFSIFLEPPTRQTWPPRPVPGYSLCASTTRSPLGIPGRECFRADIPPRGNKFWIPNAPKDPLCTSIREEDPGWRTSTFG